MHVDVTTHENNFLRIDRLKPALQPTLCASLRGRNAHGQNTRAILCGNLQGKCRIWEWAPRSSTGLYPYRKNPSIWTHCLAKNPENRKGAEKWIERRRDENRDKTHKWRKDAWMVLIFDDFCDACGTFMVICKAVIAKHGRFVSCKGGSHQVPTMSVRWVRLRDRNKSKVQFQFWVDLWLSFHGLSYIMLYPNLSGFITMVIPICNLYCTPKFPTHWSGYCPYLSDGCSCVTCGSQWRGRAKSANVSNDVCA